MSDHHHHDHGHDHGHDHDHQHVHSHESGSSEMSMAAKLEKMVSHWLKHNADHAETYRQWADRARQAGLSEVADILESVAKDSQAINTDLEKAGQVLKGK
jgi:ABC-type Zn2+ transport system substrate-binding protein/surface adhesin